MAEGAELHRMADHSSQHSSPINHSSDISGNSAPSAIRHLPFTYQPSPFTRHRPSPAISHPPLIAAVSSWQSATPDLLAARTVVVIDVLRWSTVVVTALANGADCVESFATPDQARARAAALGRTHALLGGERNNRALDGFDVGNSPLEYSRERVAGKTVVTTTSNGTNALLAAREASRVFVAAFVNLDATVAVLADELRAGVSLTFLCSGQLGAASLEDSACAGAMIDALRSLGALESSACDPSTLAAESLWVTHQRSAAVVMGASTHAQSLGKDGFATDVSACAQRSVHSLVAVRDASGAIRAAEGLRSPALRRTSWE